MAFKDRAESVGFKQAVKERDTGDQIIFEKLNKKNSKL